MVETKIDYWTCMDLAQALEQTMRNDLWITADQIAETAQSIADKPEDLVSILKQYEIQKAAQLASTNIGVNAIPAADDSLPHFSKAG